MKRSKGFTRIDLAVTLLCAAFLIMTLGAVSNRGRRRAQQLVCESQLGKWGQAVIMQSEDNGDEVMSIVMRVWGPYPTFMGTFPPDLQYFPDEYVPGEFSVYSINPYIDCVDNNFQNNGKAHKILACPSTNVDLMMEIIHTQWDVWDDLYFIFSPYAYWGGANEVAARFSEQNYSANVLGELTLDTLSPSRLLMSDNLYLDSAYAWNYNHGANGWACAFEWLSSVPQRHVKYDGEQDATGRNQLFGDGRVQWRPISLEFEDNLPSEIYELGGVGFGEEEWNGAGSGYISSGGWDFSYY
jgi:hypothetical protein